MLSKFRNVKKRSIFKEVLSLPILKVESVCKSTKSWQYHALESLLRRGILENEDLFKGSQNNIDSYLCLINVCIASVSILNFVATAFNNKKDQADFLLSELCNIAFFCLTENLYMNDEVLANNRYRPNLLPKDEEKKMNQKISYDLLELIYSQRKKYNFTTEQLKKFDIFLKNNFSHMIELAYDSKKEEA